MSDTLHDCRDAFAAALAELAAGDDSVVAVCNDSVGSSKLGGFQERFPERLVNVGIAEQNMVGTAAGLANGGLVPFVCAAACFLTGRALEQIKADVAYSNANVKLCGISSGLAYGPLGPTHHSIEDFAWLRVIPNITIVAPADPLETAQAVKWSAAHDGPVFLRLSRMGVPEVSPPDYQFAPGRAARLRDGKDVAIVANGVLVHRALAAAEQLAADGIDSMVLNLATVRPLDQEALLSAAATGGIVTCEEHSALGGMGGAVAELLAEQHPCPMRILGVPGCFAPTGEPGWLLDRFGMSPAGIAAAARELIGR